MKSMQILVDISGCEIVRRLVWIPGNPDHPCCDIVSTQNVPSWSSFQVPEPWSGHIAKRPILFLSSNPSISQTEAYLRGSWDATRLADFVDTRFDGYWVQSGTMPRNADHSYGSKVRYWSCIRNRASELLGRPAVPGVDYALSEVVHCKSQSERGVGQALRTCAGKFLTRLLSCSAASVLVLVGRKAFDYWNLIAIDSGLPIIPERDGSEAQTIAGLQRRAIFFAAPSGPEPKLFSHWISEARIKQIRTSLRNAA
jgi:hypothetical protein